jgi:hypothetical protein
MVIELPLLHLLPTQTLKVRWPLGHLTKCLCFALKFLYHKTQSFSTSLHLELPRTELQSISEEPRATKASQPVTRLGFQRSAERQHLSTYCPGQVLVIHLPLPGHSGTLGEGQDTSYLWLSSSQRFSLQVDKQESFTAEMHTAVRNTKRERYTDT